MPRPIITIDGPAGAGKSTVARRVAERLGFRFLDTGAMYRAVTWKALQAGITDPEEIGRLIPSMRLEVGDRIRVDGRDVTAELRTAELTRAVRPVAASPACRRELVRLQQEIGREGGIVTEGRDQGSVVFPAAEYKFYLNATLEERARRRRKDIAGELETIEREIEARDASDRDRSVGPLVRPDGSIEIDTTDMSIDEVVERICSYVS